MGESILSVGVRMTLDLEERNSVQEKGETPHQTRIHVSLSLNTIEPLFDLVKYRFWSREAIRGFHRLPRGPYFVSKKEGRRC